MRAPFAKVDLCRLMPAECEVMIEGFGHRLELKSHDRMTLEV